MTRSLSVSLVLVAAIFVIGVLALGTGAIPVAPLDVVRTLLGNGSRITDFAVLDLRLPRVLIALAVGAALGMSGAVFQSLSRNALGSPDIIGFNYGAATGGLLVILVFGGSASTVSVGALVGGVVTAVLVYVLAWQRGVRGLRLVLTGIGVSAILQAVNFYLIVNAGVADVTRATVWLTGSLNNLGWPQLWPPVIALALLVPALLFGARWRWLKCWRWATTPRGRWACRWRAAGFICWWWGRRLARWPRRRPARSRSWPWSRRRWPSA
nr:hypothetical protein GCM10017745_60260 [Saccharothrix mutabilis subsp. capreolus]